MQMIVENGRIQLAGFGLKKCTFHFHTNMLVIYRGFVEKKMNRIYAVANEQGWIEDKDLYEILIGRRMLGCFDVAGPIANNGNQIFIINYDRAADDQLREMSILNDIQEQYEYFHSQQTTYCEDELDL